MDIEQEWFPELAVQGYLEATIRFLSVPEKKVSVEVLKWKAK